MTTTHIAGPDVRLGDRLRQRCAWCGAALLDVDLAADDTPASPATWRLGVLVRVAPTAGASGGVAPVLGPDGVPQLPDDTCALPDLTGT